VAKGIMIVQTSPVSAEREAEYNQWYSGTHIPEICAIDGFVSARRFKLRDQPTYVAIYELEAEDLNAPLAELGKRNASGEMHPPEAVQMSPAPVVTVYELVE